MLEQVYDDRFVKQYGFFRPYVRQVMFRFIWVTLNRPIFKVSSCSSNGKTSIKLNNMAS
jgi:hypothetical protein